MQLIIWEDINNRDYICQAHKDSLIADWQKPFENISGIENTPLKALYEWCVAMQMAIAELLSDDS